MTEINDAERDFLRDTSVKVDSYTHEDDLHEDVLRAAEIIGREDKRKAEKLKTLVDSGINLNRAMIARVIRDKSFHLTPESLNGIITRLQELNSLYGNLSTAGMDDNHEKAHNHCLRQLRAIEISLLDDYIPKAKGLLEKEGTKITQGKVVNLRVVKSSADKPLYYDLNMDREDIEAKLAGVQIKLDTFSRDFERTWYRFQK